MSECASQIAALRDDLTKMGRLVLAQLEVAVACFHTQNLAQAEEIIERDDVVDNLNVSLEERCFDLAATGQLDPDEVRTVRAATKVIVNLERAGDAGAHIAKRVRLMRAERVAPVALDFSDVERLAVQGLAEGVRAFLNRDVDVARQACLREPELDARYVAHLGDLRARMQAELSETLYLLHCLSMLKHLEKVADYTLNIGEQAIFLVTGWRLKFSQYQQLDRLIGDARKPDFVFRPYWDGISGAIVAHRRAGRRSRLQRGLAAQDPGRGREARSLAAHRLRPHAARPRLGQPQGSPGAAARVRRRHATVGPLPERRAPGRKAARDPAAA